MNIPNQLTVLRLLMTPVIIWFTYVENLRLWALVFFIVAMLTDVADGVIARNYDLKTTFGTFLDPLVDKILLISMFFVFADIGLVPMWLVLVLLFREFAVTSVRMVGSSKGEIVGANWMGKTKAFLQTTIIVLGLALLAGQNMVFQQFALKWTVPIIYGLTLFMVALSVVFMVIFFYWNRNLVFKDL